MSSGLDPATVYDPPKSLQYSVGSSDSALCLPPPSSDDSVSEAEVESRSISPARDIEDPGHMKDKVLEDVFTSESENSSVATCRTVRRIDPATGEVVSLSPSGSLSFGSNLSLTVSEGDNCHRDKPLASGVQGKHTVPFSVNVKFPRTRLSNSSSSGGD